MLLSVKWPGCQVAFCVSYNSTAVIKHCEQCNLKKKEFIWTYDPTGLEYMMAEWRRLQEQGVEDSHPAGQAQSRENVVPLLHTSTPSTRPSQSECQLGDTCRRLSQSEFQYGDTCRRPSQSEFQLGDTCRRPSQSEFQHGDTCTKSSHSECQHGDTYKKNQVNQNSSMDYGGNLKPGLQSARTGSKAT